MNPLTAARTRRPGELVVPGEKLGVIEEFTPGKGTYVEDGHIYSQTVGHALMDKAAKKIVVFSRARPPALPRKGVLVVGEVVQVQDKFATIKIFKVGDKYLGKPFSGITHVSYATSDYLKTIYDAVRPGDLILGRVLGDENQPYQVSLSSRELGVIKSYCTRCGGELRLDRKQLICVSCRNLERRKISENYGKVS